MIKKYIIKTLMALNILSPHQDGKQACMNPEFQKEVDSYLTYSVPTIGVKEAAVQADTYIFLDAREAIEYAVSRIPGAHHVGYKNFDADAVKAFAKNDSIIVYCSIGYRSEIIGDKLKKLGYTHVYNLYGSIFEWANQGHPLEDQKGETSRLHTYNAKWSRWVDNPRIETTY